MPGGRSHLAPWVLLAGSLVLAGTGSVRAQALCPEAGTPSYGVVPLRSFDPVTVEAELRSSDGTFPEGTWSPTSPEGPGLDGVALEGVSVTRGTDHVAGSLSHRYDVVLDLRAWGKVASDLELVAVDGERRLSLGTIESVAIDCEAKSVSRTLSISDRDLRAFLRGGRVPVLRIERKTLPNGC